MIAKVITDLSLDKVFDYRIPAEIERKIRPGTRVKVPFGNSFRLGFVLELAEKSEYPVLKDLFLVTWYSLEHLDINKWNGKRKERGDTTAGIPEIQRIIRDHYENLQTKKLGNL